MIFDEKLEVKIEKTEKKLAKLRMQLKELHVAHQEMLSLSGMSLEDVNSFIEGRENFTDDEWELMENERIRLDEHLSKQLESVRDVKKNAQTLAEHGCVRPHWLYVR